MSYTRFEPEGSPSGRRLYIQSWYGMFYMHQYNSVVDSRVCSISSTLFYLLNIEHITVRYTTNPRVWNLIWLYDMIYDDMIYVIWYDIWLNMTYDMTWYIWCDVMWCDIYDMIYIVYLTAIGFTPGGSSTVDIYTKTIHRTTQWGRIHRTEHA
jgi:hypothetical protein